MSIMDLVEETRIEEPLRVVLYATNGVGKSTWAADAEKPLFLNIEDGLVNINAKAINLHSITIKDQEGKPVMHKVEKMDDEGKVYEEMEPKTRDSTFDDLMGTLRDLYRYPHPFKTIVLDSIDWIEQKKIWPKVAKEAGVKDISDIGFQNGYKKALEHWETLMSALNALRKDKGLNIIMLAHNAKVKVNEAGIDPHDINGIKLHKLASALIREWADFVLFAKFDTTTIQVENGFGNKTNKPIGGKERVLFTKPDPNWEAKSRFEIPEKLPLEYAAFDAAYRESLKTQES